MNDFESAIQSQCQAINNGLGRIGEMMFGAPAIESENTNPIHPSVPDDDFLADSVPHCGLDGECESCQ